MAGDGDPVAPPLQAQPELEHQPHAAAAAGLAAHVVMDERDVHLRGAGGGDYKLNAAPCHAPDGMWTLMRSVISARIVPTRSADREPTVARLAPGRWTWSIRAEAGPSVIRGSLLRLGGLVLGTLATVASSAVIIRHLGVVDTGRFVTVMALVVIVGSISDLGLSAVGVREYTVRPRDQAVRFLRNLLGMRIAFVLVGLAIAVAFTARCGLHRARW